MAVAPTIARLLALAIATGAPAAGAAQTVDLALVLAIDVSYSVDPREFALQISGTAAAFRHPAVLQAIEFGAPRGIAVTVVQWSGARTQETAVPWTVVRDAESAEALASRIVEAGRVAPEGSTAVGSALAYGFRLLETAPYDARRRIIDISGDGSNNQGEWPEAVRRRIVARGITVNGLAIVNEEPLLDDYYAAHVVGGPGAFVVRVATYEDFATAMARKLVREIADAGAPR